MELFLNSVDLDNLFIGFYMFAFISDDKCLIRPLFENMMVHFLPPITLLVSDFPKPKMCI